MTPADTLHQEARSLLLDGRSAKALRLLKDAVRRHPRHGGLALALADALHAERRLAEAAAAYRNALELDPTSANGWFASGCVALELKAYGDAAEAFLAATTLAPMSGAVRYNLGKALFELGRVDAAVAAFEAAEDLDPAVAPLAGASLACILPGSPAHDLRQVLDARRRWAEREASVLVPLQPRPRRGGRRRLRIGYISAYFGAANWMKPVFAVINRHDRADFEVFMFCDGPAPSAASGYADHDDDVIYDLTGASHAQAAAAVAATDLDVLVDLNGYSAQGRLEVLMRRPAPTIVSWFNMFATSGLAAVDWIVGDAVVVHPEEERFYCEKVHRAPGTYLAFEVLHPTPDVVPPPCLAAAPTLTFGCLGSQYKLTDGVLETWAGILSGAPNARLLLKNRALDDPSTRVSLRRRLEAFGVAAERADLEGGAPHAAFLKAYDRIDVALDTFPYNGGTTTTEALWQGVPVLTFAGDRWVGRTSQSLLLAAGLGEWVARDQEAYQQAAVALALDPSSPARLAALRAGLRAQLTGSAACDGAGLCRALEDFYRQLSAGRGGGTEQILAGL